MLVKAARAVMGGVVSHCGSKLCAAAYLGNICLIVELRYESHEFGYEQGKSFRASL